MAGEARRDSDADGPSNDGSVSTNVVSAVADRAGVDPIALPPLHDVVDPGALDSLFVRDADGFIEFRYHGYDVVVRSDGRVETRDQTA